MKQMNQKALKDAVRGACFLASGGGGAYDTGIQIADHFKKGPNYPTDHIDVVSVEEAMRLFPGKYGIVTALIGSPEKAKTIKTAELNEAVVKKFAELKNIPLSDIACVLPVELGAVSTAIACVTAAKLGIPVVDADGAGRAVPKLNMTTFAVNKVSVNPTVLMGKDDNYVDLNISKECDYSASSSIEKLARPILGLPGFDEIAALAIWLVDLNTLDKVLPIRGTLDECERLGFVMEKVLESAKNDKKAPDVKGLFPTLRAHDYRPGYLMEGKLKSATTVTGGGFDHGMIEVVVGENKHLKIVFQNESLLLWDDSNSAPAIMAPDIISCLILPKGRKQGEFGQWIYSNGDMMSKEGTLLKELEDADIAIVGMRAPKELRELSDQLENMRCCCNGGESLRDSYRSMLEELGFYGEYKPLPDLK